MKYDYEVKDSLKKYHFPAYDSTGAINYQAVSPIKVFYTLPKTIYIHPEDKIKIAVFDVIFYY